jgi:hypothetical protein
MVVEHAVDFRLQFMAAIKFTTQQKMQLWVYAVAEKLGFIAVVAKSANEGNNRKTYYVMGCERGDECRA